MFSSSTKREIRHFHVVIVQRWLRKVQKRVMHVQSCCSANLNLFLFLPLSLPSPSPSSLLKLPIYLCQTTGHALFSSCTVSSSCLGVILALFALPSTSTMSLVSSHVRESRTVLDSGFHAVDSGFQLLDSLDLCQWNLDSGFQLLVGFRIPTAVFRIPWLRIPDSTSKNF